MNDARIIVFPGRESAQTCTDFKHQIHFFWLFKDSSVCLGSALAPLTWRSSAGTLQLRENYKTSTLRSSLECLRRTFGAAERLLTWLGKPGVLLRNRNPKRTTGLSWEGGRDSSCDPAKGILKCSNPILPSASHSKHSARSWQLPALPQGLLPKKFHVF